MAPVMSRPSVTHKRRGQVAVAVAPRPKQFTKSQ
jgi:hypothetical protein